MEIGDSSIISITESNAEFGLKKALSVHAEDF